MTTDHQRVTKDERTPPVSVIVPVYNAGEHLSACLDSLMSQTIPGLEIIAVDDCSTDGSTLVLEELERAGKLRLLRQPHNGGPSAARNAGILGATGEFIGFVDADDTVSPTMYEDLHRTAANGGADIASCAIQLVDGAGAVLSTVPFPLAAGRVYSTDEMREELHRAFATKLPWFHWRNLYRRSLLAEHGLLFDDGIRKGEDSVFNLHAFSLARGCVAVPTPHYSYRKHPSSATATPLASESENLSRLGEAVLAFYAEHGFDDRAMQDFYGHILRSDLPTAIMRLSGYAGARTEVRALLDTAVSREALSSTPILQFPAPLRVKGILLLAKHGLVGPLLVLLRLGRWIRRA